MSTDEMSDEEYEAYVDCRLETQIREDVAERLIPIDWRRKALDLEMECTRLLAENSQLNANLAAWRNALAAVREVRIQGDSR